MRLPTADDAAVRITKMGEPALAHHVGFPDDAFSAGALEGGEGGVEIVRPRNTHDAVRRRGSRATDVQGPNALASPQPSASGIRESTRPMQRYS